MTIKIINKAKCNNTNLFIGISIGKEIPLPKLKEIIKYAINNTSGKIAVLIADEISKINNQVVNGYSSGKSIKNALEDGNRYSDTLKTTINTNFKKFESKIHIIKWKDIDNKKINIQKNILQKELDNNDAFRKEIFFFISEYVKRRHNGKVLSEDKLYKLSEYILFELPTLLEGIKYNSEDYKIFLYPTYKETTMSKLILDIFTKNKYKKLKDKLKLTEPITMIEYYIN